MTCTCRICWSGRRSLDEFKVLVACGGFSYGDVLGGGGGWAKSILYHASVRDAFAAFFARDTLSLGVCNGCQMFAHLKELIPGAGDWPRFVRNRSEQFEGRTSLVRINRVDSPWLAGMAGSVLPIAVAHGEGRAEFAETASLRRLHDTNAVALQFVDNRHDGGDHVSGESERRRRWHRRRRQSGRARARADAASGTGVPQRQQLVASARSGAKTDRGSGCSGTRALRSVSDVPARFS